MSLRVRLGLATTALVLVGLVIAGGVTFGLLQSFLLQRVDQQLQDARRPALLALNFGSRLPVGPGAGSDLFPGGTVGEIVGLDGSVIAGPVTLPSGSSRSLPDLPAGLGRARAQRVFTTGGTGASPPRFRVLVEPVQTQSPSGALLPAGALIVAIPLTEVDQTLHRLLLVESLVALAVVLGLGGLSWWMVRRELRPLERIGETAGAIAAGDLSRRVEHGNPRTEVGRLGIALNGMLARIEEAFEERRASERRLRRFLADASHELRTPLTSIRGYAELFRRGADSRPQDLATSMRRIEEQAGRMGVIVDDLLLLARLDRGRPLQPADVDLVAVAADAVEDARVADPTRTISVSAPAALVVQGDEARLRQVAANLLSNALRHTPAGTPVEVGVASEEGRAVLEVTDHGPGIPAESLPHVFEPFYRLDPSRARAAGGAGLGLSIVAAIVQAHGGTVAARSVPGQGTSFRVTLPGVPPGESPAPPAPPAGSHETPNPASPSSQVRGAPLG